MCSPSHLPASRRPPPSAAEVRRRLHLSRAAKARQKQVTAAIARAMAACHEAGGGEVVFRIVTGDVIAHSILIHGLEEVAATPQEEDIRVLSPDLVAQWRKKIKIMQAHWLDYDRLFTAPMAGAAPR